MNDLKKEYKRIRHNIQNRLYRARIQGIEIKKIQLPKIPKEVTEASIRKLKRAEDKFATNIYKAREKKRKQLKKSRKPTKTKQNVKSALETPKITKLKTPKLQKGSKKKKQPVKKEIEPKTPAQTKEQPEYTPIEEPEFIPPNEPAMDLDTRYDIAVERVFQLLEVMDNYPIEVYSHACKQGATQDIQDFIGSNDKQVVVETLESWDMEEITVTFYDSNMADMYCHERIVAQHLALISQTISDNMDSFNEVDDYMTGFEGMMYMDD